MMKAGNCIFARCLTWSINFTPVTADAKLGLSDIGEKPSPRNAALTTAPAVMAGGTPSPSPTADIAIPMVPNVPQEVPHAIAYNAPTINVTRRKILGVIIRSPTSTIADTVPAAIHAPIIPPTDNRINTDVIIFPQ